MHQQCDWFHSRLRRQGLARWEGTIHRRLPDSDVGHCDVHLRNGVGVAIETKKNLISRGREEHNCEQVRLIKSVSSVQMDTEGSQLALQMVPRITNQVEKRGEKDPVPLHLHHGSKERRCFCPRPNTRTSA